MWFNTNLDRKEQIQGLYWQSCLDYPKKTYGRLYMCPLLHTLYSPLGIFLKTNLSCNLRFWLRTKASRQVAPQTAGSYSIVLRAHWPSSVYWSSGILHHWYLCNAGSSMYRIAGQIRSAGLIAHRNKYYRGYRFLGFANTLFLDNSRAVVRFPPAIAEIRRWGNESTVWRTILASHKNNDWVYKMLFVDLFWLKL